MTPPVVAPADRGMDASRLVAATVAGSEARQAAGFHTIAEAARALALRHLDPPDDDAESAHAAELRVSRLMAEPVFARWRLYYESWLVGCIRDGSIRGIDRELWESRAPYQGDPADAIFPARLLVLAEDVNRLEKARGSALAPLRAIGRPTADTAVSGPEHWILRALRITAEFRAACAKQTPPDYPSGKGQALRVLQELGPTFVGSHGHPLTWQTIDRALRRAKRAARQNGN